MSRLDEVRAQRDAMTGACANMLGVLDLLVEHTDAHLTEPTAERLQALRAALQAVRAVLPTIREAVVEAAKVGEKEAS